MACYPGRVLISALALIGWQGQFPCTGVVPPHHCHSNPNDMWHDLTQRTGSMVTKEVGTAP